MVLGRTCINSHRTSLWMCALMQLPRHTITTTNRNRKKQNKQKPRAQFISDFDKSIYICFKFIQNHTVSVCASAWRCNEHYPILVSYSMYVVRGWVNLQWTPKKKGIGYIWHVWFRLFPMPMFNSNLLFQTTIFIFRFVAKGPTSSIISLLDYRISILSHQDQQYLMTIPIPVFIRNTQN